MLACLLACLRVCSFLTCDRHECSGTISFLHATGIQARTSCMAGENATPATWEALRRGKIDGFDHREYNV